MITPENVAAAFGPLRLPESRRLSEGWVVCWARRDESRQHFPRPQEAVRAWYVPGRDGKQARGRAARAVEGLRRAAEREGWRVMPVPPFGLLIGLAGEC
jgi:hypothetical protein